VCLGLLRRCRAMDRSYIFGLMPSAHFQFQSVMLGARISYPPGCLTGIRMPASIGDNLPNAPWRGIYEDTAIGNHCAVSRLG
jgi:hypothetical protein